jgi:hypothetical protein
MARKRRDLAGQAEQLGTTTAYDRTLDAATDTIEALVPFAGPLVAGLLRQVAPRDDRIYLAQFARDVAAAIDELDATKIDRTYFESDDWAHDAGRTFESVAQIRNRTKRSHYVAALANSAPLDRPQDQERHRFLDLLDAIRPSHLRLLAVVVRTESQKEGGGIDAYLTNKLPDHDLENIKLDWADLERAGVLQGLPTGLASTSTSERVWAAFNRFGRRFAAFVEATGDDVTDTGGGAR